MKKFGLAVILTAAFIGSGIGAMAMEAPIDIEINEQIIKTDSDPFIQNGHTLVPMRVISEVLGKASVVWNQEDKQVTVKFNGKTIELEIGKATAKVNGNTKKLPVPAQLVNNRTYLPVRWLCEQFGAGVSWQPEYHMVSIVKDGTYVPPERVDNSYSKEDVYWMSRIIHAESQGESMKGKIAVGNVIRNRVHSKEFPGDIYSVIFDRKYGVQFQPISNGTIYNTPSADSVKATKLALNLHDVAGDSLYFLNPRIAGNFWIVKNRPYNMTIGNHDFYL